MGFKKPEVKKIKNTMESLQIYLRAEKKFGKTTLFRDIVLEKFGNAEKGMLIGVGDEQGYNLLDEINATQVETAKDFIEAIDWLVSEKGKEHDIRIVGVDVVDELIPMFEKYTCQLSVKETGKACKSVNSAFGGYGEGQKRLVLELKRVFTKLKKAGIGTIAIAHTKTKNIKRKEDGEGEGYMILSSALQNNYEAIFGDIFDIVMTGIVDRVVEDGKVVDTNRYLYFRGDGFVDAGCRFANGSIPDRIEFNESNMAETFIEVMETAMKNSRTTKISDKEFKKLQEQEEKENLAKSIEVEETKQEEYSTDDVDGTSEDTQVIDEATNKAIMKEIKPLFTSADKEVKNEVKKILKANGLVKFDTAKGTELMFKEILGLLKK